eukprot:4371889-Pyramimonas_sp.AAC.1
MTTAGVGCALPVRGLTLKQRKARAAVPCQMRKQQRSFKRAAVCQVCCRPDRSGKGGENRRCDRSCTIVAVTASGERTQDKFEDK